MSISPNFSNPVGNKLLAALPQQEYERLLPHLEPVSLSLRQVLYQPNEQIEYAYFLSNAVGSLLNLMESGHSIEAATVGNEGMVGVPLLLATNQSPLQALIQIPGDGLRIRSDVFKAEVLWGSPLHTLLLRYTQMLIDQISQTAACNCFHPVERRCCRWLLMTHDRVGSDSFPLTQEFLSYMLGVRRASVSEVAATLQQVGLIDYHRGNITIRDRQGLLAATCECYQNVNQQFQRLLD